MLKFSLQCCCYAVTWLLFMPPAQLYATDFSRSLSAERCLVPQLHRALGPGSTLALPRQQELWAALRRPTDGSGFLGYNYLGGQTNFFISPGNYFKIWYSLDHPEHKVDPAGHDDQHPPAYILMIAQALDRSYQTAVTEQGYRPPPVDDPAPSEYDNGGDSHYDVYILDLAGRYYGVTVGDGFYFPNTPIDERSSYMILDNNYLEFPDPDPIAAAQVTVAHEFFHAVQYGYRFLADNWLSEGSAVWFEDVVYPEHDGYLMFVNGNTFLAAPETSLMAEDNYYPGAQPYGVVLFYKYLAQSYGEGIIKRLWEGAMLPGELSAGVDHALYAQGGLEQNYHRFAAWNLFTGERLPRLLPSYDDAALYDSVRLVGIDQPGRYTTELPGYAAAYYRMVAPEGALLWEVEFESEARVTLVDISPAGEAVLVGRSYPAGSRLHWAASLELYLIISSGARGQSVPMQVRTMASWPELAPEWDWALEGGAAPFAQLRLDPLGFVSPLTDFSWQVGEARYLGQHPQIAPLVGGEYLLKASFTDGQGQLWAASFAVVVPAPLQSKIEVTGNLGDYPRSLTLQANTTGGGGGAIHYLWVRDGHSASTEAQFITTISSAGSSYRINLYTADESGWVFADSVAPAAPMPSRSHDNWPCFVATAGLGGERGGWAEYLFLLPLFSPK